MVRGGGILVAGNGLSAVASFARNVIIARIISVEDFGMAMLFGLTMSAIEMASDLSIGKMLIQAKNGNSKNFQSTAHTFQLIRGAIGSVVLFLFAGDVALIFKVPDAAWAFQWLAICLLIKGFSHLDIARFQRDMNFLPLMWVGTLPQLLTLILSAPLAIWLEDYSVMIYLLVIQTSATVFLTHILATRRFVCQWDLKIVKKIYLFGWPLLLNGIFMFAILQGDKAIVGSMLSMETLGWYGATFSLTLAPAMLIMRVTQSVLLPVLSKAREDKILFESKLNRTMEVYVFIGSLLGFSFVVFGADVLLVIFGEKYSDGVEVVAWLGLIQLVRIAKAGPVIVSLSIADTKNPMISNTARAFAFVLAVAAIWNGFAIKELVMIGLMGEIASFFLSIHLLGRRLNISLVKHKVIMLISLLLGVFLIFLEPSLVLESKWLTMLLKTSVLVMFSFLCLYMMPNIRDKLFKLIDGHYISKSH